MVSARRDVNTGKKPTLCMIVHLRVADSLHNRNSHVPPIHSVLELPTHIVCRVMVLDRFY
jgi:hypothetical protein